VTVAPAENLRDGQHVQVNVRGFSAESKVFFSECPSIEVAANLTYCGEQPAAQPVVITDDHGNATSTFVVSAVASSVAIDLSQTHACGADCVLVAAGEVAGSPRYAIYTLRFASRVSPPPNEIAATMERTVEVASPSEHFAPGGEPLTTADGRGGFITAVVGIRSPTADSKGQLVFLWHNQTFIGWSSDREAFSIIGLATRDPYAFWVTYVDRATSATILYRWDGRSFTPYPPPPVAVFGPTPVYVRLVPSA
jgi:hypothetical protein